MASLKGRPEERKRGPRLERVTLAPYKPDIATKVMLLVGSLGAFLADTIGTFTPSSLRTRSKHTGEEEAMIAGKGCQFFFEAPKCSEFLQNEFSDVFCKKPGH